MELIALLVWPVTLMFIAYCVYATYQSAQDRKLEMIVQKYDEMVRKLECERDFRFKEQANNLNEAEDRLEKLYLDLEAKITVIQNGLQWQKK
jgi:hypothetical protein